MEISELMPEHGSIPIQLLRCPDCGAVPNVQTNNALGTASCSCGEVMCIVEGIVISSRRNVQDRLLDAIHRNDRDSARQIILDKFAWRTRWIERLGLKLTFRRFIRHGFLNRLVEGLRITKWLEKIPPRRFTNKLAAASQFNSYIRNRFTAPWFQSPLALLGLLEGNDGLVLDAPCGMGHLAYMVGKLVPPERVVCIDLLPQFVFCTKRFFIPNARLALAHDMGQRLPLESGRFSLAYVFDSFQYIPNKQQVARELLRIVRDDGVVSILHSPNPAFPSIYNADAIKPLDHLDLFPGCDVRIYPSKYLADSYLSGRDIDLNRRFSESQINQSPAVDIVVAKSPGILRVLPNVRERLLDAAHNVQLSDQYRMRQSGQEIVFEEQFPESLAPEYRDFDQILPPRLTIPAAQLKWDSGRPHFDCQRELLRQHILVDLPDEW